MLCVGEFGIYSLQTMYQQRLIELIRNGQIKKVGY